MLLIAENDNDDLAKSSKAIFKRLLKEKIGLKQLEIDDSMHSQSNSETFHLHTQNKVNKIITFSTLIFF